MQSLAQVSVWSSEKWGGVAYVSEEADECLHYKVVAVA